MALFKYQCVYFGVQSGGYTRQSRNPSSYAGFMPLNSSKNDPGTNFLQPGSPFHLPSSQYPDPTITQGGATYSFSFINISGLTTGGATSFNIASPPSGTVSNDASAVLQVLVVYLPEGGPGPNGAPGAVIDAFDETAGTLFNNYFVVVSPDSGNVRYDSANIYGYVNTTDQPAAITVNPLSFATVAPSSIAPPNVNFEQWQVLSGPPSSASGTTLNVGQGQTEYALAFYNTPVKHKEWISDKHKEAFVDQPLKLIGDNIIINPGDPVELGSELQRINQAVQRIAHELNEIRGNAFIKGQDRPNVGRSTARDEFE
jgi:hypothetical protein